MLAEEVILMALSVHLSVCKIIKQNRPRECLFLVILAPRIPTILNHTSCSYKEKLIYNHGIYFELWQAWHITLYYPSLLHVYLIKV